MQSLWMVAAGLSFALMGVCVKYGALYFSAAELVFYRSLVQMAGAFVLLRHLGMTVTTRRLGMHAHRGVAGFVSLFMFFYALASLPVATAMTLNYTSPLFLTILLAWFARERPGVALVTTVLAGFGGCLLLLQPTLAAGETWPAAIGLAFGWGRIARRAETSADTASSCLLIQSPNSSVNSPIIRAEARNTRASKWQFLPPEAASCVAMACRRVMASGVFRSSARAATTSSDTSSETSAPAISPRHLRKVASASARLRSVQSIGLL